MIETKISCDMCSTDMNDTGTSGYYIGLNVNSRPTKPFNIGEVRTTYSVFIHPPLDKNYHFCGLGCLKKFLENK